MPTIRPEMWVSLLSLCVSGIALVLNRRARIMDETTRAKQLIAEAEGLCNSLRRSLEGAPRDLSTLQRVDQLLSQAIVLDKRNLYPLFLAATARHWVGQNADARTIIEKVLKKDPKHLDALCLKGSILRELGDVDGAEAVLQLATSMAGKPQAATLELARLRDSQGRSEEAVALMKIYSEASNEDPEVLANYGAALGNAGKYSDAVIVLRKALSRGSRNSTVYQNLVFVLGRLDEVEEAQRVSDVAITLFPDNTKTLTYHGALIMRRGGPASDAEKWFRQALSVDPTSIFTMENLINLLHSSGRRDEALKAFSTYARLCREAGRSISPSLAEWHFQMAVGKLVEPL